MLLDRLNHPSWRARPLQTGARVAASLVRRQVPVLRRTKVWLKSHDIRVRADLATASGLGLYRYGWHDDDVELVSALLKPGDVFVDGGANRGMFTLAAARRVGPAGRVFAFEPSHETFAILADNIAVNEFTWVSALPAALAAQPSLAAFASFSGDGSGLSSFAREAVDGRELLVPVVTLDMLLSALHGRAVSVLKLDLEGAEHDALLGAQLMLAARPHLWIEVVPSLLQKMGSSAAALIADLRRLGYEFFRRTGPLELKSDSEPTSLLPNPNVFATTRRHEVAAAGVHFVG